MKRRLLSLFAVLVAAWTPASAQEIEPEVFRLDNGMEFLLIPREDQPLNVAAGWVARVGSVNEPRGMSGITHFLEHMMFKGSDSIGTSDADADRDIRRDLESLRERLFAMIYEVQYPRYLAGEIDDPWSPVNDTPEIRELRSQMTALQDSEKDFTINNDFDRIYTREGASGMNAQTFYDWTRYFITVPSNKLELWCWLESDRLGDPSLREFDAEKDVVVEERRQRYSQNPTGYLDEQAYSLFWISTPYAHPVIGWPSDLQSYEEDDTRDYFELYYQPRNLTGVIVGDFDPAEAKDLIRKYFGRLEDPGREIPPVRTTEMDRLGKVRMEGECDCQPQVSVGFQGVPYGHEDEAALEILQDILNGRTGRLYKSMIEGSKIASGATAYAYTLKYAGAFFIEAQVKGDATPEQLEDAIYAEVERLRTEPVSDRELQKVKNANAADAYRGMVSNMGLLQRVLIAEAYGSWEDINTYPRDVQGVTADDVLRVAEKYLDPERMLVTVYRRRDAGAGGQASAAPSLDEALAGLPEEARDPVRAQIEAQLAALGEQTDPDALREVVGQIEASKAQSPAPFHPVIDYMIYRINERIAELESTGGATPTDGEE